MGNLFPCAFSYFLKRSHRPSFPDPHSAQVDSFFFQSTFRHPRRVAKALNVAFGPSAYSRIFPSASPSGFLQGVPPYPVFPLSGPIW